MRSSCFSSQDYHQRKLILGVGFFAKEKEGKRRAVSWKKLVGEKCGTASGIGAWLLASGTGSVRYSS